MNISSLFIALSPIVFIENIVIKTHNLDMLIYQFPSHNQVCSAQMIIIPTLLHMPYGGASCF